MDARAAAASCAWSSAACDVHMLVHGSPLAVNDFLWESLDDDELALRLAPATADAGRAAVHAHRHPVAARGRTARWWSTSARSAARPTTAGARSGTRCSTSTAGARARRARAGGLRLARRRRRSMRAAGLPEPFVETIETGWWTTCLEVVPPPRALARALPRLPRGDAGRLRRRRRGLGRRRPSRPTTGGRSCRCSAPRCSRRGCGSTRTSTATWPATTASWPPRPPRAGASCRPSASARCVDEAVDEGFARAVRDRRRAVRAPRRSWTMVEYASERLETVVLTNAMLFTGRRARELQRLAGRARLVLQSSIDGARPETHDRWRGAGSWAQGDGRAAAGRVARAAAARGHDRDARQPRRGRGAARAAGGHGHRQATTSPCARSCSAGSRRTRRAASR